MEEYTWEDIINPSSEQAKSYIGKRCYFANTPNQCLKIANSGDDVFCFILEKIKPTYDFPFVSNNGFTGGCIIPKKEEPKPEPKYVPFKNSGEFISEFEDNTPIMHVYGLWIYEKIGEFDERVPRSVTELWGDGVVIGSDKDITKWEDLLERFVFENNEPCGKLQEEK